MALNFPANPAVGDIYRDQGVAFQWTGTVWVALGASPNLGVPTGTVAYFAGKTPPDGWLLCDNQRVTPLYPNLRDYLLAAGSPFGVQGADPRVPELRGEFIRGFDGGRGVDAGRVFGSSQAQDTQDHKHNMPMGFDNTAFYGWQDANGHPVFGSDFITGTNRTSVAGATQPAQPVRIGFTGTMRDETGETRPRNVALLPCIKAFDAVDITGMADLSQLLTAVATEAQVRAGLSNETLLTPANVRALSGQQAIAVAGKTIIPFSQVPLEATEIDLMLNGVTIPANGLLSFDFEGAPNARAFSTRSSFFGATVGGTAGDDNGSLFLLDGGTTAIGVAGALRLVKDTVIGSWSVSGSLRRATNLHTLYTGIFNLNLDTVARLRLRGTLALTDGVATARWRI